MVETLGYVKRDHLFRWAIATIGAAILPAVAGIYHHSIKCFAGVLNGGRSNRAASGERSNKCDCDEAAEETQHSDLIAKTSALAKISLKLERAKLIYVNDSHVSDIAYKMRLCFALLRLIP